MNALRQYSLSKKDIADSFKLISFLKHDHVEIFSYPLEQVSENGPKYKLLVRSLPHELAYGDRNNVHIDEEAVALFKTDSARWAFFDRLVNKFEDMTGLGMRFKACELHYEEPSKCFEKKQRKCEKNLEWLGFAYRHVAYFRSLADVEMSKCKDNKVSDPNLLKAEFDLHCRRLRQMTEQYEMFKDESEPIPCNKLQNISNERIASVLSCLQGDLNYDRVAKAKKILKGLLS